MLASWWCYQLISGEILTYLKKKNIFLAQKLTKLEQFQPNGAPAHSLNACKAPRPEKSQTVKVDPGGDSMWCAQETEPQITLANPIQGPCQTKWTQIAHFDIQNLMVVAPPLLQIYPNLTKLNLVEVCCGPPPSFKVTTFCTNTPPLPESVRK